jgi:hypothetical protein
MEETFATSNGTYGYRTGPGMKIFCRLFEEDTCCKGVCLHLLLSGDHHFNLSRMFPLSTLGLTPYFQQA